MQAVDSPMRWITDEPKRITAFFRDRGYPCDVIESAHAKARAIEREDLLQDHSPDASSKIPLVLTFNHVTPKVAKIVHRHAKALQRDPDVGNLFDNIIITGYRREANLGDRLIHSQLPSTSLPGTFTCGRSRCSTCPYVTQEVTIVGPNATLRVKDSFTCTTKCVVYCITCCKCGDLYIGQTKRRLADRFVEHLRDIRLARPDKTVAQHFNQPDHSIEDAAVCGIRTVPDASKRRTTEVKLIRHLGTLIPQGMNIEDDL